MSFKMNRVKNIVTRPANTTIETRDAEGHVIKTVKEFNLGHAEIMLIQEGLDNLDEGGEYDKRAAMAYLEWVLGSCADVEITIRATYEV